MEVFQIFLRSRKKSTGGRKIAKRLNSLLSLKTIEKQGIAPTGETVKNAGGYFEEHKKEELMYTMYFIVYTNYKFKTSVVDGVEIFFTVSMFMIVKELSYTVEVCRTTSNIC